jgi:hypothetical protein
MVSVGWMLSWRWTICCPVWLMLLEAACRIACARLLSLLLVPASAPTLRSVEGAAALNSMPQWFVDLVLEPGIALRVGAGLALQHDRVAVRHDEAGPDQEERP